MINLSIYEYIYVFPDIVNKLTRSMGMLYDILTGHFTGVCTCYVRGINSTMNNSLSLFQVVQYLTIIKSYEYY